MGVLVHGHSWRLSHMHVPAGFLVRHCTTVYVTEISMIFFTFFMRKAKISTYLFLWKIKTSKGLLRKAKKKQVQGFFRQ